MEDKMDDHFFHSLTRRQFLTVGAATGIIAASEACGLALPDAPLAMPGPYRGRVVEVAHRDSVVKSQINPDAVRKMMQKGMCALTGEKDEAHAWARFFRPKDVVGVKICTVGEPLAISQPETIAEVVRGLMLVGVKAENIILFNRYQEELEKVEWKGLPAGVRHEAASPKYDDIQTSLDGYDSEVYVEFPKVMPGQDKENPVNRRSHLCTLVSKRFDKVVNVCALKDHSCAGITMALKNMSHGFNNNVCRTHPEHDNNWSDIFIPAMVNQKPIRQKVVLHIGDALIGCYDGGPGTFNKHFATWEQRSIFFGTDPVAMDRIGWTILDRVRVQHNQPKIAESGRKRKSTGHEPYDYRQPEHVIIAGKKGLGEWDLTKIKHERVVLA
jgi:hypothetical protein